MQTRTFNSYSDPGHGWVKVPRKFLKELGIEDKITPYSYQRDEFAYLEEDCDVSTFINVMKEKNILFKFRHYSGDKRSRIRSYDSFTPSKES